MIRRTTGWYLIPGTLLIIATVTSLGCNDSSRDSDGNPVQSWWKENVSDKDNDNLQEDLNEDAKQARDNVNESAE